MMFPSVGRSSFTTSVTRLHWWAVWRLRADWWWWEVHSVSSLLDWTWLSESRRVNK